MRENTSQNTGEITNRPATRSTLETSQKTATWDNFQLILGGTPQEGSDLQNTVFYQ